MKNNFPKSIGPGGPVDDGKTMMDTAPRLKLIVCLGNPGGEYQDTRHNAGWMAGDEIMKASPTTAIKTFWQPQKGELVWTTCGSRSVLLLKPLTYMNLSGEAVAETLRHFRITPMEMLVICDDLDQPEGALRIRQKGSSGGHRGLASIITHLQTTDFPRLRVGIGRPRPQSGTTIVEWVLAPWVSADYTLPRDATRAAAQIADTIARGFFQKAAQEARMAGKLAD